ncbi:MAG: hypothetical protein VXZ49_05350, partial [Planctomycetota bacterium]|nr:hypothetical protein [Planctomycetota bacterium]
MKSLRSIPLTIVLTYCCGIRFLTAADGQESLTPLREIPPEVQGLIERACLDCHDQTLTEQQIRLDSLDHRPQEKFLDLLNQIQEQVYFEFMPPEDGTPLEPQDRTQLLNWIQSELKPHNASKLEEKLARPEFGNYVDHDELFSGQHAHLPGFTFDRRWLISEYIFDAKMNRILKHRPNQTIDGKREWVIGDNNRRVNLTNPFLLSPTTGVRYYANETLNGGHLLTMLTNARELSSAIFD